jgi:hypothetical protein
MGLVLFIVACAPTPSTIADACFEFGTSWCDRANACGALGTTPVAQCRTNFTSACCNAAPDCAASVQNPPALARCNAALNQESCGNIIGQNLPTECVGWNKP